MTFHIRTIEWKTKSDRLPDFINFFEVEDVTLKDWEADMPKIREKLKKVYGADPSYFFAGPSRWYDEIPTGPEPKPRILTL